MRVRYLPGMAVKIRRKAGRLMWKQIDGYRFPYRISDLGEVQRQMPDGGWKPVKPWLTKGGGGSAGMYLYVKLATIPKGHKRVPVVRLMEGRFIRPRKAGEIISHRNGMAGDCSRWNLYHTCHQEINQKIGGGLRRSVEKIDADGNVLELYRSVQEAADKNYVSKGCVTRRCMGKVKNPYDLAGYTFQYERRADDGR